MLLLYCFVSLAHCAQINTPCRTQSAVEDAKKKCETANITVFIKRTNVAGASSVVEHNDADGGFVIRILMADQQMSSNFFREEI